MSKLLTIMLGVPLLILSATSAGWAADAFSPLPDITVSQPDADVHLAPPGGSGKEDYACIIKIYMIEPDSRWDDSGGDPYEFGCFEIPYSTGTVIPDLTTHYVETNWDGSDAGFNGVTPDNVMAYGVVFEWEGHTAYSDPPTGNPFTAYYVDAAAAASPGMPGENVSDADFTHTVFVEEATSGG